jgi:two-component system, NarL family, response regulator NreC
LAQPEPIEVLLVDDHAIVRSAVRRILADHGRFVVVGEASDAASAQRLARNLTPAVIVLDVNLGATSGLDIVGSLRETGARVVVLSMNEELASARFAFEQGAQGYVLKDAADEELVAAIDAVLADRVYVHPSLAARLVLGEPVHDDLSERERDVLRLIALGYTNHAIGQRLFLSVRTIESHRHHILTKLGLSTRADLVRYALERRMVQVGD